MQSLLADVLSLLPGLRGSASMAIDLATKGLLLSAHKQHNAAEGKEYVAN